mgnify:CR=1 FL=1
MERPYLLHLKERTAFPEIVYECKQLIILTSMAFERTMLGDRLNLISEKHRSSRDFTLQALPQAFSQGSMVSCCGNCSMLPPRISSSVLNEVTSMTNSGAR